MSCMFFNYYGFSFKTGITLFKGNQGNPKKISIQITSLPQNSLHYTKASNKKTSNIITYNTSYID